MQQELIDCWYAAVRAGDSKALADVVTADIELTWNGDPKRLPWAGTHLGIAAVLAFFQTLGRYIEVVSVVPIYRLDAGNAAVVVLEGCWLVRDTGHQVTARACNVFRFRDGRIASYEVYNDSGKFADALRSA
jgi:uncharacterized protein